MGQVLVAPPAIMLPKQQLVAPSGLRKRLNCSLPIASGAQKEATIATGNMIRYFGVELQYTLIYGTAAFAPANMQPGDEFGIIKSLMIQTASGDVILNLSGPELRYVLGRANKRLLPPNSAFLGSGTAANVAVDRTLVVPFWLIQDHMDVQTELNTTQIPKGGLTVKIQWGTISDVTTAAGASLGGLMNCNIWTLESFGGYVPDLDFRINRIPLVGAAASAQGIKMDLPTESNLSYYGFTLHQQSSGSDAQVITSFSFASGGTRIYDSLLPSAIDEIDQQVNPYATATYGDTVAASSLVDARAWTFFKIPEDGYKTEAVEAAQQPDLTLKFDFNSSASPSVIVYLWTLLSPKL